KTLGVPHRAFVGGDSRIYSIACASIVAKVARDRLMRALARRHPAYAWEQNAGYGTPAHIRALREWGMTAHHRGKFCEGLLTPQG
ncbi:MAG: ribonuclease HII, partial [Gemmatimonadaceae bacterium]|nr:ribonuclease HII [Gemmatimonadaceae bacterium]